MMLPPDLAEWSRDQRLQWMADELWTAALLDESPAPPGFVAEVEQLITWVEAALRAAKETT